MRHVYGVRAKDGFWTVKGRKFETKQDAGFYALKRLQHLGKLSDDYIKRRLLDPEEYNQFDQTDSDVPISMRRRHGRPISARV